MLKVCGLSERGEDHTENQDCYLIWEEKAVFAVADGVSIPAGGGTAARLAIEYLKKLYSGCLEEDFLRINERLLADRHSMLVGYTTLTAAQITGRTVKVVNVGDSPAYLVRRDKLLMLTTLDEGIDGVLLQALGEESIKPHMKTVRLQKGDCLLLVTDGISDALAPDSLISLAKSEDPCRRIVEEAKKADVPYRDDKTIVVIKYE